jgi:hypothetical protein
MPPSTTGGIVLDGRVDFGKFWSPKSYLNIEVLYSAARAVVQLRANGACGLANAEARS